MTGTIAERQTQAETTAVYRELEGIAERLREKVNEFWDRRGEQADQIKSDSEALRRLTWIEGRQIADNAAIDTILSLARSERGFDVQE